MSLDYVHEAAFKMGENLAEMTSLEDLVQSKTRISTTWVSSLAPF